MGQKPQVAVIVDILPGTDGEIKMSKSLGNDIPILAEPADMYGKVMSIPDHAMPLYFKLATRFLPAQVAEVRAGAGRRHSPPARPEDGVGAGRSSASSTATTRPWPPRSTSAPSSSSASCPTTCPKCGWTGR